MTEVLTYEALKAERDQLAVENVAIKAMNDCLSEELRGYESDGAFEGPHMHLLWWKTETPATDAALAAIEVRGVEKLAAYLWNRGNEIVSEGGKKSEVIQVRVAAKMAEMFANELREAK